MPNLVVRINSVLSIHELHNVTSDQTVETETLGLLRPLIITAVISCHSFGLTEGKRFVSVFYLFYRYERSFLEVLDIPIFRHTVYCQFDAHACSIYFLHIAATAKCSIVKHSDVS